MGTIFDGPRPGLVCPAAEVRPTTIPCALNTGPPAIHGLVSMSEAISSAPNPFTTPDAVCLNAPIALLTAITLSPTATPAGFTSAVHIGAATQFGHVARLAQRTAISFSLSATRSVAATLCSGSNCTVIISEGPITRWLVRIRPFWSTINPVPCPNSLQTITTESNIDEGACSPLIWPCTSPKSPKKNTKAACLLALYMACAANLVGVIAYSRIQVATHRSLYSLAFACTSDRELI